MGKVKRIRQKYHSSLKKEENQDEEIVNPVSSIPQLVPIIEKTETVITQSDNLFAGLQIKLDIKNTSEATVQNEADRMSITSSSGFQKTLSKKTKRQQRKDAFLKKIDTIRAVEREEKERKKREKTAIVGDVHPMLSALPSLEELLAASSKQKKQLTPQKARSTKKQKKEKKDMLSDLQLFMTVHRDQEFKKDPFAAVSKAVQNRVLYEDEANKK